MTIRRRTEGEGPATRTILDSGAYSAYTRGVHIDEDEYIAFCVRYQKHFSRIIVLDTIPPKTEEQKEKDKEDRYAYRRAFDTTSAEAAEQGAARSYAAWVRMREAGIKNCTPVFHRFERLDWLKRYLEEGADYICLGPGAYSRHEQKRQWLDQCFGVICSADGRPKVGVHGLAITSVELIMRYPWTSVDSAAWAIRAGYGVVLVPEKNREGEFDFGLGAAWAVSVSIESYQLGQRGDWPRRLFRDLSSAEQQHVHEYLRVVCGRRYSQVALSAHHRRVCNSIFFHELSKAHNVTRFFKTPELL